MIGRTLAGTYTVMRVLHRGAISTVYGGEQRLGANARPVAIKVLERGSAEDRHRFISAAGTAAQLEDRHAAPTFDLGTTDDDVMFLVMPLLAGQPVGKGPMPLPRVLHLLGQLSSALEEMHARSLAYLHLKPGHLLVDASDTLTLVDFASACAFGPPPLGPIPGASAYMSPEQLAGDPHDARSDVHALALLAQHLLTGAVPPFGPISALPQPQARALATGFALDPAARFRTVTAFLTALAAPR